MEKFFEVVSATYLPKEKVIELVHNYICDEKVEAETKSALLQEIGKLYSRYIASEKPEVVTDIGGMHIKEDSIVGQVTETELLTDVYHGVDLKWHFTAKLKLRADLMPTQTRSDILLGKRHLCMATRARKELGKIHICTKHFVLHSFFLSEPDFKSEALSLSNEG